MDGVQELLSLAPGTKFNVVPVTNGNVLVLPIQAPPPPLISDTVRLPLWPRAVCSDCLTRLNFLPDPVFHTSGGSLYPHSGPDHAGTVPPSNISPAFSTHAPAPATRKPAHSPPAPAALPTSPHRHLSAPALTAVSTLVAHNLSY